VNVPNIEIAEMALNLISEESFSGLIVEHAEEAMQILLAPIERRPGKEEDRSTDDLFKMHKLTGFISLRQTLSTCPREA
jgi:hypothetical protein